MNLEPRYGTILGGTGLTVATLLQAHPPGWAFECLGPNVQLELEPTKGGLIIQSERYIPVSTVCVFLRHHTRRHWAYIPVSTVCVFLALLFSHFCVTVCFPTASARSRCCINKSPQIINISPADTTIIRVNIMSAMKTSITDRLKSHSVLLVVFVLVVIGVIVWKLTAPAAWMSEGFLDAGLAEIRAQVLASAAKKQSPGQMTNNSNCPLRNPNTATGGVAPCFLGLKDMTTGDGNSLKPLPELAPVAPRQFPKCLRCEDVLNRAISITPANGAFGLGHFLAKKKDNNSVVIIPEVVSNSAIRRITDGNFRLILGLADPLRGVTIYHPESDRVIARDAAGRVALAPISDFAGELAPAATFELVDGPTNYSTCAFKCIPINTSTGRESSNKYLGFTAGATPGGMPLSIISGGLLQRKDYFPIGATYEFDLVDIETGVPVIMNKHSGKSCQGPVLGASRYEGFESGDMNDTESNVETRDKRLVRSMILEGELGNSEILKQETNGPIGTNTGVVSGYQQEIGGMKPANLAVLLGGLPQLEQKVMKCVNELPAEIERPFASENFADTPGAANSVGMLPITLDELGKIPDNLFKPAAGLAYNNALNVQNQVYKDQLADTVFQKLNAAKLSPSVQNILDYNTTAYKVYQDENQDFADKINMRNRSNTDRIDTVIGELDKQRVTGMSKDLFFMKNQFEKANARPATRN